MEMSEIWGCECGFFPLYSACSHRLGKLSEHLEITFSCVWSWNHIQWFFSTIKIQLVSNQLTINPTIPYLTLGTRLLVLISVSRILERSPTRLHHSNGFVHWFLSFLSELCFWIGATIIYGSVDQPHVRVPIACHGLVLVSTGSFQESHLFPCAL